jgi:putative oxidoreductase
MLLLSYLLSFCRVFIGLVFIVAFISKVRDAKGLEHTIAGFRILPPSASRILTLLLLTGEILVAGLMIAGGSFLAVGFALAIVMLLLFCAALASVIIRGIQTPCDCFGPSKKPVSYYDIWRNLLFILCAGIGWWLLNIGVVELGGAEQIVVGLSAFVILGIWLSIQDIVGFFRISKYQDQG